MKTNQERSVEKRIAILLSGCDLPTYLVDEEMKVSSPAMDSEEFNLHKDYHNAIDCLIHCERLITYLQEQLVSKDDHIDTLENILQEQLLSKDDHIATLENKLVHMSLELASAKALEDEHRLLKRRISTRCVSNTRNEYLETSENDTGPKPSPALTKSLQAHTRTKPKHRPRLFNSWNSGDCERAVTTVTINSTAPDYAPQVQATDVTSDYINPGTVETAKPPQSIFSLSRVRTWVSTDDTPLNVSRTNESSAKIKNSSDTNSYMTGNAKRPNSLGEFPRRGLDTIRTSKKQSSLSLDAPSKTQRTISSFGNILGLKRNVNQEFDAAQEIRKENVIGGSKLPRRDSDSASRSSSRSCISEVKSPVSSRDCLHGCNRNDFERRRRNNGTTTDSTANEEWPSFR